MKDTEKLYISNVSSTSIPNAADWFYFIHHQPGLQKH